VTWLAGDLAQAALDIEGVADDFLHLEVVTWPRWPVTWLAVSSWPVT
jgi:hypothetical protein